MTLSEWRRWARQQLPESPSAALDADVLLMHHLSLTRVQLLTEDRLQLSTVQQDELNALLTRRQQGEPIAYIVGEREFWSLPFKVAPCTLIPRPDTETLVAHVLSCCDEQPRQILDLGTGTGAILLALLSERQQWHGIGLDINPQAVALADENAQRLSLAARSRFMVSDWFSTLTHDESFSLIVSNPPYIAASDPHLYQGDVRFEPHSALVAEDDGLAAYRFILQQAPRYLELGGRVVVEHGYQQQQALHSLFAEHGFDAVGSEADLAGQPRLTYGIWMGTAA